MPWFKHGNVLFHVRMAARPRRRCRHCDKLGTVFQCDARLKHPKKRKKTCDAHLCAGCAFEVGPDKHLCRWHMWRYRIWLALRELTQGEARNEEGINT